MGAVQAELLVNDLLVKNWHLLIITAEEVFITSDNPVSFLLPRLVGVKESPVFLPLSPKKALYIHPYKFSDKTLFLDSNQVDYFVKETVKHAKESVYSNTKSNKLQEIVDMTPFNLSNLNYEFNFPPYFQIKTFWKSAFKHFAETRND